MLTNVTMLCAGTVISLNCVRVSPNMALETSEQPNLPEILQNPEHFTYSFLENITRGFSEENNIGNGGYGAVFQVFVINS